MHININSLKTLSIIALFIAICLYSPLSRNIYKDWINARREGVNSEKIQRLLDYHSSGKYFEVESNNLFAGNWKIAIKPLSDKSAGIKVSISPTPPDRAGSISRYIFHLSFLDSEGFVLFEYPLFENIMTVVVDDDGVPQALQHKDTTNMPIDMFAKIDRIDITYNAEFGRDKDYEMLRTKSAAEILQERRKIEKEAEINQKKSKIEKEKASLIRDANTKIARENRVSAWRQLKKGMTKHNVEEILGQPVSVHQYTTMSVYKYESFSSVTFSQEGIVTMFTTPTL